MKWLSQLQGKVIGLDTAPLIYFIEQNEAYLELVRAFFQAMSQGEFQVFELIESSVLRVCKICIHELAGLADHYFLSELNSFDNSVGWGPSGLELRGKVRITSQEMERVERFMTAAKYNICLNNCEHFANYVLYGLNFSSQQHMW